jgi:hypothetical protein
MGRQDDQVGHLLFKREDSAGGLTQPACCCPPGLSVTSVAALGNRSHRADGSPGSLYSRAAPRIRTLSDDVTTIPATRKSRRTRATTWRTDPTASASSCCDTRATRRPRGCNCGGEIQEMTGDTLPDRAERVDRRLLRLRQDGGPVRSAPFSRPAATGRTARRIARPAETSFATGPQPAIGGSSAPPRGDRGPRMTKVSSCPYVGGCRPSGLKTVCASSLASYSHDPIRAGPLPSSAR